MRVRIRANRSVPGAKMPWTVVYRLHDTTASTGTVHKTQPAWQPAHSGSRWLLLGTLIHHTLPGGLGNDFAKGPMKMTPADPSDRSSFDRRLRVVSPHTEVLAEFGNRAMEFGGPSVTANAGSNKRRHERTRRQR